MSSLRFTKTHEWIQLDGEIATIGITEFAQDALGDVVYVELPEAGREAVAAKEIAVVESVKAASEIYAPVNGVVIQSNGALADDPALVNKDPLGEGWFFKMRVSDVAELDALLDQAGYDAAVAETH